MAEQRARLQSIDVYRGLAILAMAAYHSCWDLTYYGLIETGIGVDPLWITAQRTILTSFLLLTGAGLTLGHSGGIKWPAFWRREAVLVAAALAVTAGTWFLLQDYYSSFGVLHAIALCSLLALPFVIAPIWTGLVAAAVALLLPLLYSSDLFDPRWLAWIGFFKTTADTADLVPVFPWLGVVLLGVVGMRVLRNAPAFNWQTRNRGVRALGLLGRWSLIIYLVHQPLLLGVIAPLSDYLRHSEQAKLASFTQSCTASCATSAGAREGNGGPQFCTAYCQCALETTVRDNLWDAVNANPRTAPQQSSIDQMSGLCTAMAE